ncbi:MAG: efflux RND transporter periplasmic adaptor subunit [Burkholderiales bacterium]|nr:efflux RND transporter periplasmic adaptor subunit [Burkholderiales bacterium]
MTSPLFSSPVAFAANRLPALTLLWVATLTLLPGAGALAQKPIVVGIQAAQVRALGLSVVQVAPASQSAVSYPAQLKLPASRQQVLAAPVSGLVTAIQVDAGATVRQGQGLVRLRSTQAQALRSEARAAQSQQELAERNLQRDEKLLAEGLIPRSRHEQSQHDARVARLNAQQQQQAVAQALGGAKAHAQGDLVLVAPLNGQVTELMVEVGQRVDAAAPLLKVASVEELLVELQVPAQQARGVQVGQGVSLVDEAGGGTGVGAASHSGRVSSVGATLDERTQSLTVRARVRQGPAGQLRPGQWLQARLQQGGEGHVLPEAALITLPASPGLAVFVEEAVGRYRLQPVKLLGRQGADVSVSGLGGAVKVVTHGTAALKALLPTAQP